MLNSRSIFLGAFLALPLISHASTTSFFSTDHDNIPAIGIFPITDTGTGSVRVPIKPVLSFNDVIKLAVDPGKSASIQFSVRDTNALSFSSFSVFNPETSTSGLSFYNLAAGNYTFNLSGATDGTIGGLYSIQTAITTVPVPTTFWLMSSAIFGLISFGKRRVS